MADNLLVSPLSYFGDVSASFFGINVLVLSISAFTLYWMYSFRPAWFPPGPPPIPFLGTFHSEKTREEALAVAGAKYGPVFSVSFNSIKPVVIVNDFEVYLEDMKGNAPAFANRPYNPLNSLFNFDNGIVGTSGTHWLATRKFALMALRDNGMGSKGLVKSIVSEADHLTSEMKELAGQPALLRPLFTSHIINMVSSIVFGKRYETGAEEITKLDEMINSEDMNTETLMVRIMMGYNFMAMMPKFLINMIPISKSLNWFNDLVRSHIESSKETLDPENPTSVVDMWLIEQAKAEGFAKPFLNRMDVLVSSIMDLYFAGIETTSMTLNWATLFLAKYPDLQERIYADIVKQIGADGEPQSSDIAKLPFFNAFIHEVMRMSSIAPQGVEHCTTERVKVGKYILEPNTTVTLNQYNIHHDARYWKYPDEFNPHNFLDEAGSFKCPQQFLAFGYGSRVCIGQNLAKVELFVFLARVIQTFRISACGEDVDLSSWGDFLRRAKDQKLVLEPRKRS